MEALVLGTLAGVRMTTLEHPVKHVSAQHYMYICTAWLHGCTVRYTSCYDRVYVTLGMLILHLPFFIILLILPAFR